MSISQYKIKKTLDKGSFAKVKLAKDTRSGERVALKIIHKTKCDETAIKKEVAIMRACRHSHIVKYKDVIQDDRNYYIIMEYIDGKNLFDYVLHHGPLPEYTCKKYITQLVSAVRYCHSQFISHRDLKLENIMVDKNDNVKIIDFGMSTRLHIDGSKHNTWCGSPLYVPPEIYMHNSYASPKVDVWCIGVILYAMLTQHLPFGGKDIAKITENIVRCKYKIPINVPIDAANLVHKILRRDPDDRISLEQIQRHRWLADAPDVELEIPMRSMSRKSLSINLLLIEKMESLGFDGDEVMKAIRHGESNEYTTVYYDLRDRIYEHSPTPDEVRITRGNSEPDLHNSSDDIVSPTLARSAKIRKNSSGQKFLEKLFT
jgi:serine/threonine protein kinase